MRLNIRLTTLVVLLISLCLPARAQGPEELVADLVADLGTGTVESIRINLNAWGANLGFEAVIAGDHQRIAKLIQLVQSAEPGAGHKCPNVGAVRFVMTDGRQIALGLLPSHDDTGFELRLYNGEKYVGILRTDREQLLSVLGDLGVPREDPWL